MGRFFTNEDIQYCQIPDIKNFSKAMKKIRREFNAASEIITYAMFFGSTVYGAQNHRSDIDILVIYELKNAEDVQRIINTIQLQAREAELYTPINFLPILSPLLTSPHHSLGSGLIRHLKIAERLGGNIIEGREMPLITDWSREYSDYHSYLRKKIDSTMKAMVSFQTESNDTQVRMLGSAYRGPINVIRRKLYAKGVDFEVDSSAVVLGMYENSNFTNNRATNEIELLHRILELDAEYSTLIAKEFKTYKERGLFEPHEDQKWHHSVIEKMYQGLPLVRDFLLIQANKHV